MLPRSMLAAFLATSALGGFARADDKQACIEASEEGQKLRSEGKLSAARAKFLACAQASCPTVVRSDCATWLGEIDGALSSIVVVVRDEAGTDVAAATVSLDGGAAGAVDGKPIQVDPGKHVLTVHVGANTTKVDVVAVTGEKNRAIVVKVPRSAPIASTPEPPPPSPSVVPWVLGGVGLVALGAAGFVGYSALSDRNRLRDSCAPRCAQADIDGVERKRLVTDVLVGVSLVSLGVATFLFLRKDEGSKPAVGFMVGPTSAALDVRIAF